MDSVFLGLRLTPHGRLVVSCDAGAPSLEAKLGDRLQKAFERGSGHGLLLLGAEAHGTLLPPVFSYWREFGAHYVTALCLQPESETGRPEQIAVPSQNELERMALVYRPALE